MSGITTPINATLGPTWPRA